MHRHRRPRGRRASSPRSVAASCTRPTSTTCSPTARSRRSTRLRRARAARERHRHGARVRRRGAGRARAATTVDRRTARAPGFFAWVDGAPAEGYRAPRADAAVAVPAHRCRRRPPRRSRSSPASTARGCSAPLADDLADGRAARRCALLPVDEPVLRRQHRASPACSPAPTSPRALDARRRPGERYLLPDVVLSNGRFLDGTTPDDLPRPVEVVATDGAVARAPRASAVVSAVRTPRRSPSSAGRTSASRRSSTGSSVAATPSSRRSPASRATARSSPPSGTAATFIVVDTGGWLAPDVGRRRRAARPSGERARPSAPSPTPT